ncbi:MAG: alpha/beta hydrolase fold domain-containing protein [Pseudomonadota bacterium]
MISKIKRALLTLFLGRLIKPFLTSNVSPNKKRTVLHSGGHILNAISRIPSCNITQHHIEGVNVTCCAPKSAQRPDHALIYAHGGSYVIGNFTLFKPIVSHLAHTLSMPIYFVDYTLAPDATFPTARDQVCSVHAHLLNEAGLQPEHVFILGDSAGGGISASAIAELMRQDAPPLAGLILLSPLLDPSCAQHEPEFADNDLLLTRSALLRDAALYAGDTPLTDPNISVSYLADDELTRFPPTLILCDKNEILCPESRHFAKRLSGNHVDVTLTLFDDLWHDAFMHVGFLDEAEQALEHVNAFVAQHT